MDNDENCPTADRSIKGGPMDRIRPVSCWTRPWCCMQQVWMPLTMICRLPPTAAAARIISTVRAMTDRQTDNTQTNRRLQQPFKCINNCSSHLAIIRQRVLMSSDSYFLVVSPIFKTYLRLRAAGPTSMKLGIYIL